MPCLEEGTWLIGGLPTFSATLAEYSGNAMDASSALAELPNLEHHSQFGKVPKHMKKCTIEEPELLLIFMSLIRQIWYDTNGTSARPISTVYKLVCLARQYRAYVYGTREICQSLLPPHVAC